MSKYKFIMMLLLACSAGCTRDAEVVDQESSGPVDPAVAVSEDRLEKLSEIVRSLRDSDSNMTYPSEADFFAAARKAYPAKDGQNDVLLDGWGNPFVYRRQGDNRSYRLHSMGPNGTNEYGTGDDAPSREGETIIE